MKNEALTIYVADSKDYLEYYRLFWTLKSKNKYKTSLINNTLLEPSELLDFNRNKTGRLCFAYNHEKELIGYLVVRYIPTYDGVFGRIDSFDAHGKFRLHTMLSMLSALQVMSPIGCYKHKLTLYNLSTKYLSELKRIGYIVNFNQCDRDLTVLERGREEWQ